VLEEEKRRGREEAEFSEIRGETNALINDKIFVIHPVLNHIFR